MHNADSLTVSVPLRVGELDALTVAIDDTFGHAQPVTFGVAKPDAIRYRHADPAAHFHTLADAASVIHAHPFAADSHPYDLARAHPRADAAAD